MFDCYIRCYPWDVMDEGVEAVLDRLQGEIGATGLTLPAVGDEAEVFRPHVGVEPKIFRTSGGVYFKPNMDHYRATRLKPLPSAQHGKADVVAEVASACAARKLDLRVEISPFHARRMVSKHPGTACKNAYGIASRHALCPADPDVQEYLAAVLRDLSIYDDVSAIVLDEVQCPCATDLVPYLSAHAMLGSAATMLLGACFSEATLRAADADGLDGQAALRSARILLDRHCALGAALEASPREHLDAHPGLARYLQWMDEALLKLFRKLRSACSKPLILSFGCAPLSFLDNDLAPEVLDVADRVLVDADDLDQVIESLNRDSERARQLTPASVGRMELFIALDEGVIDDAPEVVRQITRAAEAGACGVTVAHYGAILDNQFEWIHRGLRHARRLAET